jgi:hypothetical protein
MADPWLDYSPTQAQTPTPASVDTGTAVPKVDPWLAAPSGEQTAAATPQAQLFATPENPIAAGARGILEGAKAPFDAAWETAKSILSDPDVGFLPAEEHQLAVDRAAEFGVKGSVFWSGMLAGGGAANLGKGFLSKSVLGAAAGMGASKLAEITPAVVHQELSPVEAAKEVGTATAYGALFGAAIGVVPGAAKLGAKAVGGAGNITKSAVNKILDVTPGGPQLREGASQFFRQHFAANWDKFFTSGQELLKKVQLGGLATQLRMASSISALTGGRWNADFAKNVGWIGRIRLPGAMSDDEIRQAAFLMIGRNMNEVAPGTPISGFPQKAVNLAISEARRLRAIGLRLQKAGVQVFDPESGNSHTFILRKDYGIPIRYNNPDAYKAGGEFRDAAMAKIKQKLDMTDDRAAEWLDGFAQRLQAEQEGIVSGAPISAGTNHFMMGRALELPGYETDLRDILPQYYEYAARRLANHVMFGPVHEVENATRQAVQQELFAPEEIANNQFAAQTANPVDEQMFIEQFKNVRGRGIPKESIERRLTTAQIVRARLERAQKEVQRDFGIEQRYPRAFSQLEQVEDPAYKDLATKIVRRQLGAIDRPTVGEGLWKAAAQVQVVTKLAFGAIAQPSQILSGVVRTQYKGVIGSFFRTLGNDPEALDLALRAGVILRGIVRQSEQSLTGGGTDFLEKVFFTQADMKSRVFGALQGASFAEHQAQQLYRLSRQAAVRPSQALTTQIGRIESRLAQLGLDTQSIVARGGNLSQNELLRAAQKVSSDVNFWGDALSLPEFFRSPAGRYLTMFKSFGFQQGKLFKDAIAKPAVEWLASDGKRGDIGPLTRFAVLTPAGGEIIADIKKVARGRDPRRLDRNLAERVIENIANGAGFGLAADAFEATKYGLSGTLGWAGGPITTEGGKLVTNVGAAARGNPRGLAKQVIETGLPVAAGMVAPRLQPAVAAVAPAISNILLPPEKK